MPSVLHSLLKLKRRATAPLGLKVAKDENSLPSEGMNCRDVQRERKLIDRHRYHHSSPISLCLGAKDMTMLLAQCRDYKHWRLLNVRGRRDIERFLFNMQAKKKR